MSATIVMYEEFRYICTMSAKNEIPAPAPASVYRKELEYLYARRSAINSLIESLEDYDRFRAIRMAKGDEQTA